MNGQGQLPRHASCRAAHRVPASAPPRSGNHNRNRLAIGPAAGLSIRTSGAAVSAAARFERGTASARSGVARAADGDRVGFDRDHSS